MTGLNLSSADGARPRPALLVAGQDPASDEAVPVVKRDGERRGVLGTLRTDPRSRAEFFALARVPTSPEPM